MTPKNGPDSERVASSLAGVLEAAARARDEARKERPTVTTAMPANAPEAEPSGRYDFDLAEFPLFRFCKPKMGSHGRDPIVYTDTIRGKDGESVTRRWKAYPGPFGFGGASTHVMLYDLLQLYVEQGCLGSQIQFGTLRAVFRRRQPDRHPGAADFRRMRRDLDILEGYHFKCTNAFWDRARQAYVDMTWRLFDNVFYFKGRPDDLQQELPFGFIQVNRVLQEVARSRGFFALGFESRLFYGLRPIEGRLAIYLAKLFTSQSVHRRPVEDLARALPIESPRQEDVRRTLKSAADGLLAKGLRILKCYRLEKGSDGRWVAEFERKERPNQDQPFARQIREELSAEIEGLVHRIIEATGNPHDRNWWIQCASRLGQGSVDRALGQLKETAGMKEVRNRGALLTKIFKDIAKERELSLK